MKEFHATPDLEIETTAEMDPSRPGQRSTGFLRACVTVYDETDKVSPTLPTIREVLARQVDSATGLLVLRSDRRLRIDPSPLRSLSPHLKVSEGASFITRAARERLDSTRTRRDLWVQEGE